MVGRYRDSLGREKRVSLASDKRVAQAMLDQLVRTTERELAGLVDPSEKFSDHSFEEHLEAFETHLKSKEVGQRYRRESITKIRRAAAYGKWDRLVDITPSSVARFLDDLKRRGLSVQTRNHYLKTLKHFIHWAIREKRLATNPIDHIATLNPKTDRRHDRRALSQEEFRRLIDAAETGQRIEGITGPDRAIMYLLAAWTGYRKGELGSLTIRSFDFDTDPPSVTVEAAYSKRRRRDTQYLKPSIAREIQRWIKRKAPQPDEILFPISAHTGPGIDRKTGKMMRLDLEAARRKWLAESKDENERKERSGSDFLKYQDQHGRYADFHSNRHTFITRLERSGVSPRMAQALARHSDIRLTMNTYTHLEEKEKIEAVRRLR